VNSEFGLDMRLAGVSNSNTWNINKVMYHNLPSGTKQNQKNVRKICIWRVGIKPSTCQIKMVTNNFTVIFSKRHLQWNVDQADIRLKD
jgi:hypothetical protein